MNNRLVTERISAALEHGFHRKTTIDGSERVRALQQLLEEVLGF
jgi:hypothetical protein